MYSSCSVVKHKKLDDKTRGGLRTQKQNDSKQIRVIIGLFPFRLLPAPFWKMNIMGAFTAKFIFSALQRLLHTEDVLHRSKVLFCAKDFSVSKPLSPACCLAPSQRSSPQAISTVSPPSSMLSRSLPAKLSASYLHLPFLPPSLSSSLPSFSSPSSLPSSLPSFLPSFSSSSSLPAFLPSFLLSFLPISVQHYVSLPRSKRETKREPKRIYTSGYLTWPWFGHRNSEGPIKNNVFP